MPFLDAWLALGTSGLARLLVVPIAVLAATFLPGRPLASTAALVVALALPFATSLELPNVVTWGWSALWLAVSWQVARGPAPTARTRPAGTGGFEAGVVALPLGLALFALLMAAAVRQPLDPVDERRATLGAFLVGAGTLHLMLRRHARRGALAFAAAGLGLELLAASVRAIDVQGLGPVAGAPLLAAALAVALTIRIAGAREQAAGAPLVSDAHELHD